MKKIEAASRGALAVLSALLSLAAAPLAAPLAAETPPGAAFPRPAIHVPSPDWSEQIIYFVMTDRFCDGNKKNSDQKKGEYDPSTIAKYSGGDIAGITGKLDYIKGLGATAVWITPPVANQWWDPMVNYGGYHGYWAENLMKVDRHLGTLADYRKLSTSLHANGMYLIQDIVPNHMGNFFRITGQGRDLKYAANPGSVPVAKPSQTPFGFNNFLDPAERERAVYHWTPGISNFDRDSDRWTGQLSDLDDLNTGSPEVVDALKRSYSYWIRTVGVDAFRVDTVKYVEHGFWNDFLWSEDPVSPGIMAAARSTGRENFVAFGECWNSGGGFSDAGDRQSASYLGTAERPELSGLLNFSLQSDMSDVFARGKSTDRLGWRLEALERNFGSLTKLYNFLDNHDMGRFLASASVEDLETALLFMYTIPGVPVIYYGTEQGFTESRASMFAGGYGSLGVDHFDTSSRLYSLLSRLAKLRLGDRAFTRGKVTVIGSTREGAGILAYRSEYGGKSCLTVINTATRPSLGANLAASTGASVLHPVFSLRAEDSPVSTGSDGTFSVLMPAKSAIVYEVSPSSPLSAMPDAASASPAAPAFPGSLSGPAGVWNAARTLTGSAEGLEAARIVIDGNWKSGLPVSGRFSADVGVDRLSSGDHTAVLAGTGPDGRLLVSSPYRFTVDVPFVSVLTVTDPAGDDSGPAGTYRYPLDSTFRDRQCDIRKMEVLTAGTNLRLVFTMNGPISTSWGPQNGFDHVTFYIYFTLPGSKSRVTAMPKQNGVLPGSLGWDYFSWIGGWNNALYGAAGADASNFGTAMVACPDILVDRKAQTVTFTWRGDSFDGPESIRGMKVSAFTWDYDGMSGANRLLAPEAGDWNFGGGDFAKDPLVMDSVPTVTLP